jgi:uncharacterized membrane protein
MSDRQIGNVLLALGIAVALFVMLDIDGAFRPIAALVFFSVAPGAAIVLRLHVDDALLRASLAVGISVAVSMTVAMVMLWAGVSSPVLATFAVLGVTAIAAYAPRRSDVKEVHA